MAKWKCISRAVQWFSSNMKHPPFRHIIVLYIITFFIILPAVCFRLKFSVYYYNNMSLLEAQDKMRTENDQRISKANIFLDLLDQGKLHAVLDQFHPHSNTSIDIAISIITVNRNRASSKKYEPKYLTQVVWKFLSLYYKERAENYPLNIQLGVCNVDSDPDFYSEAKRMGKYIPVFNRFKKRSLNMVHILEKEKQDYVFCLNTTLHKYKPQYVLLVEDDALPHDDFFQVLHYMVQKHLGHKDEHGLELPNTNPLVFIKLYHPERLLGFLNIEIERIPEMLGIGFLFGTIGLYIYMCLFGKNLSRRNINLTWLSLICYFILIAICVGRQNIMEIRRLSKYFYSYVPTPGCCTPAMLFPENGANIVIDYLNKTTCRNRFGKDMALDQMRWEKWLSAYMISPNLFTHIGMYSSLRQIILDPFIV